MIKAKRPKLEECGANDKLLVEMLVDFKYLLEKA